jgi:hypothetical protein
MDCLKEKTMKIENPQDYVFSLEDILLQLAIVQAVVEKEYSTCH